MNTLGQIEDWLLTRVAILTGTDIDAIDLDTPFSDYSLDSSAAVTLVQELCEVTGRDLSVTLFWEYPSIRLLASNLVAEASV